MKHDGTKLSARYSRSSDLKGFTAYDKEVWKVNQISTQEESTAWPVHTLHTYHTLHIFTYLDLVITVRNWYVNMLQCLNIFPPQGHTVLKKKDLDNKSKNGESSCRLC